LSPQIVSKLERLAAANINLVPADIPNYFLFERGGFCALVGRAEADFGHVGSAGLLHEQGFGALVWRGEEAYFVGKGFERSATPDEIAELRRFQSDLDAALA
jgi:hypothetical protein